jgi:hypothetical protein
VAALTVQQIVVSPTGTLVTYAPATSGAGGDTVAPDDRTWFEVNNGSGGSINATLDVPGSTYGQANQDLVIPVAAGTIRRIGPLVPALADPTTGLCKLTYSAVTSVTVAAVRC